MRIGFDAKRAFHNPTGLGNYSRTLLQNLAVQFPDSRYVLFNPKQANPVLATFLNSHPSLEEVLPDPGIGKRFSTFWRVFQLAGAASRAKVDLFHGLSNELPVGIHRQPFPTVVSQHDLIYLRHPEWYPFTDRMIYLRKSRYACRAANKVIAISEQTKRDLISFLNVPESTIRVVYQSISPVFLNPQNRTGPQEIRRKFDLPEAFLLFVGQGEGRKNLEGALRALALIPKAVRIPLVVLSYSPLSTNIQGIVAGLGLKKEVLFRQGVTQPELAGIYPMATALLYPSYYEGFGLPVVEALQSGTAVVAASGSSLEEAGGAGALYPDPGDPESISAAISLVLSGESFRNELIEKGKQHIKRFSPSSTSSDLMDLYRQYQT
jgi:glycosyltransferase involved in cell wall biosynthesis